MSEFYLYFPPDDDFYDPYPDYDVFGFGIEDEPDYSEYGIDEDWEDYELNPDDDCDTLSEAWQEEFVDAYLPAFSSVERQQSSPYSPGHGRWNGRAYRTWRMNWQKRNQGDKGKTLRNHRGLHTRRRRRK